MPRVVDMHMHVGFAKDPAHLATRLDTLGMLAFANTVTPGECERIAPLLASHENVYLGTGLHPWWVPEESDALDVMLEAFDARVETNRYVGEVGLDFSPKRIVNAAAQSRALEHVTRRCAILGDRVISLHCVRAASELFDILEASGCLESCTCILHSYGGSSDGLTRAIEDGCRFSVGKRMLRTKRGREYARVIPRGRLLLESDLPTGSGDACTADDIARALQESLDELARIRGVDCDELGKDIATRSARILERDA